MSLVAVTMRRDEVLARSELRDGLETGWLEVLDSLGHTALPVPNDLRHAQRLVQRTAPDAVLLSGGGSPAELDIERGPRDLVEQYLIQSARASRLPLLGVCRGLQSLILAFGGSLQPHAGHVGRREPILSHFGTHDARCFHERVPVDVPNGFTVIATASDGAIEAIEHCTERIRAVMWHPERTAELTEADAGLLRDSLT